MDTTSELGKRYGKLVVIARDGSDNNRKAMWKCQCDCGNICRARTSDLHKGHTTSCGCNRGGQNLKNLLGQRFGTLTVVKRMGSNAQHEAMWECQCDCGNTIIVSGHHLRDGHTKSCGCQKSQGELWLHQWFSQHHINYSIQYTFTDLKDIKLLKFDFAIIVDGQLRLVEYDGPQHFYASSGWNDEDHLKYTQKHDEMKNDYCIQHNIPLLRLRFSLSDLEKDQLLKEFLGVRE